jgi:Tfp pilus assembly PilM family ATPase
MIGKNIKKIKAAAIQLEQDVIEDISDRLNRIRPIKSVGIDISDRSIEVVEISRNESKYEVNAGRVILEPNIVRLGRIIEREKLAAALKQAMETAEPKPIVTDKAFFAVPETQVFSHSFKVDTSDSESLAQIVALEAQTTIPINFEDQIYSFRVIESPVGTVEEDKDVLIMSTSRSLLREWHDFFASCNIKINLVDFETVANYRGLFNDDRQVVGLIDIGAVVTTFAVLNKNNLYYTNSINYGGEQITQKIVEEYAATGTTITTEEVNAKKIALGLSEPAAIEQPKVENAELTQTVKTEESSSQAPSSEAITPPSPSDENSKESNVENDGTADKTVENTDPSMPAANKTVAASIEKVTESQDAEAQIAIESLPEKTEAGVDEKEISDAVISTDQSNDQVDKLFAPALRKALIPIIEEIKTALDIGQERSVQPINRIIITGGTAAMKGIAEFFNREVNSGVDSNKYVFSFSIGEPFKLSRVKSLDLHYIEALGLAFRGISRDSLSKLGIAVTPENLQPRSAIQEDESTKMMISGIKSRYQEAAAKKTKFIKQRKILKIIVIVGSIIVLGSIISRMIRLNDQELFKFAQTSRPKNIELLKIPVITDDSASGNSSVRGMLLTETVDQPMSYDELLNKTRELALLRVPSGLQLWTEPVFSSSTPADLRFPASVTWLAYSDREFQAVIIDDIRQKVNGVKFVINSSEIKKINTVSNNVLISDVSVNYSVLENAGN